MAQVKYLLLIKKDEFLISFLPKPLYCKANYLAKSLFINRNIDVLFIVNLFYCIAIDLCVDFQNQTNCW